MFIEIFNTTNEANEFIKTVKPLSVEYTDNQIVVFYNVMQTPQEVRADKIKNDKAEALAGLEEAQMTLQYLETVGKLSDEDAKIVEGSIKGCQQNIKNYRAKLNTVLLWEQEK